MMNPDRKAMATGICVFIILSYVIYILMPSHEGLATPIFGCFPKELLMYKLIFTPKNSSVFYLSPFVLLQGESLQGEPLSIKWRGG